MQCPQSLTQHHQRPQVSEFPLVAALAVGAETDSFPTVTVRPLLRGLDTNSIGVAVLLDGVTVLAGGRHRVEVEVREEE